MISEDELRLKTIEVLAEEFELDPADMTPEATLYDDLDLDSLDTVDMVVVLEKTFQIKMGDEEALRAIRTMDDLYRYLLLLHTEKQS